MGDHARKIGENEDSIEIQVVTNMKKNGKKLRKMRAIYYFSTPTKIIDVLDFLDTQADSNIMSGWIIHFDKIEKESIARKDCIERLGVE